MKRYFRFIVRQKRKNADRYERRPWLWFTLETLVQMLRIHQLQTRDSQIRELTAENEKLRSKNSVLSAALARSYPSFSSRSA